MPGMNVVKHMSGPSEHNKLSNNTDKLPDTVIWPCNSTNLSEKCSVSAVELSKKIKYLVFFESFPNYGQIVAQQFQMCRHFRWTNPSDSIRSRCDCWTQFAVIVFLFAAAATTATTCRNTSIASISQFTHAIRWAWYRFPFQLYFFRRFTEWYIVVCAAIVAFQYWLLLSRSAGSSSSRSARHCCFI